MVNEQVEIFTTEAREVEQAVNKWLEENSGKIMILDRHQSYHPTKDEHGMRQWLAISIWYKRVSD